MKKLFVLSVIIFGFAGVCVASDWKEESIILTKITDGDTIKAVVNGENESIRLLDIDCFETSKNPRAIWQSEYYHKSIGDILKQGFYSKQRLEDKLKGKKELVLKWKQRDKYKRILGKIYLDDEDINEYMLKNGGCQQYVDRHSTK